MSEKSFHESVQKADRWSRAAALVIAVVGFVLIRAVAVDVQFASITAAVLGIAVRLYVPYHVNLQVPADERMPLNAHPAVGAYHHGAAGLGLIVLAVVAVVVFVSTHALVTAVGVGFISGVVGYLVLGSVLPA